MLGLAVGALAVVLAAFASAAAASTSVEVAAAVDLEARVISGTARVRFENRSRSPHDEAAFLLFAERFREEPAAIDDLARHQLLWEGTWRAGAVELEAISVGGVPVTGIVIRAPDEPAVLRVPLDPPLEPGAEREIEIRFTTRLPAVADVFGAREGLLLAGEAWFPVPLEESGRIAAHEVRASVRIPDGTFARLGAATGEGPVELVERFPSGVAGPLVVSALPIERRTTRISGREVVVDRLAGFEIDDRIGRTPPPDEAFEGALAGILPHLRDRDRVTVVVAPLEWIPTWSSPAAAVVSDRLFELFAELRPLHARELAYALFLSEELRTAGDDEPPWVAEGLAWRRAQELYEDELRAGREVRDWIRLFDVFAIVDRFETAPRIPLARPFFPVRASDDALGLRPRPERDRPPGRVLFDELERRLGEERFAAILAERESSGRPLADLLPPDALDAVRSRRAEDVPNVALRSVERSADGVRITIGRDGEGAPDAVPVAIGEERRTVEVGDAPVVLEVEAPADVTVAIDPERRLLQSRLDDDRDPAAIHVLLDSADVEVSSTEFGFSTLFVARRRYDYRKDLAAAPFVTDRGYGGHAGFQLHGGPPIDRNLFRRNLFVYFAAQELDRDFHEDGSNERGRGALTGFGLRYNDYDAYWLENPSRSHHLRVFVDGYDRAFGGRHDFVQAGGSLALTRALRADTVVAAQVLAGFTIRTGDRAIPPQGLYSLGGFRAIRGIGAGEALDRHLLVGRLELRHRLPVRLDLSLEDLLVARRLQLKTFVDVGRVAGRVEGLDDVGDFAVGAGVGANLFYDFFGFFPTSFYLDLATRVDASDSVQVLFGARQPF